MQAMTKKGDLIIWFNWTRRKTSLSSKKAAARTPTELLRVEEFFVLPPRMCRYLLNKALEIGTGT